MELTSILKRTAIVIPVLAGLVILCGWLATVEPAPEVAPPRISRADQMPDPRFMLVGRSYVPALGRIYAAAWIEGAKALEAGQSVDASLGVVARSWESGRQALFDRWIAPGFGRIVPEGRLDAATPAERKLALARAWRGFARGLDPQSK